MCLLCISSLFYSMSGIGNSERHGRMVPLRMGCSASVAFLPADPLSVCRPQFREAVTGLACVRDRREGGALTIMMIT